MAIRFTCSGVGGAWELDPDAAGGVRARSINLKMMVEFKE